MKQLEWIIIIICVLINCNIIKSQQVISTSGKYYFDGSHSLSWTVGEPVIMTLSNGMILTQGFQQPIGWDVQVISLPLGWSIFSTYIYPVNPQVPAVMAQLSPLILAKDGNGNVYWPEYNVNNIGSLILGKGYQLKMQIPDTLVVTGIAAVPENTALNMPSSWSIIGYLRKSPAPVEQMLGSIDSYIIIVKNSEGNVYWPAYSVNNIGSLFPGKGYQIKLQVPLTFYYQANSESLLKEISLSIPAHFPCHLNTGNNMTICIPDFAWNQKPQPGDEIGIKDKNGQLVGSGVYQGNNLAFPIWGTDFYENESPGIADGTEFSIWLWNHINGNEAKLEVAKWKEGNEQYETDGISIVEKFRPSILTEQLNLRPNPAKEVVITDIIVIAQGKVLLGLLDDNGRTISTGTLNVNNAGEFFYEISVRDLSSGHYTVRMQTARSEITKDLIVIH
jgi:hypothetical protein